METVIRIVVIYIFLVLGLRITGKREFGQMSPLELVTLLIIPELVSESLIRDDHSLTNAIVAVATLLVLVYISSLAIQRSKRVETLVAGEAAVLVHDGKFLTDAMNEERVTPDEIFTQMHNVGIEQLEDVKWALLESDGQISVVPYPSVHTEGHRAKKKPVV